MKKYVAALLLAVAFPLALAACTADRSAHSRSPLSPQGAQVTVVGARVYTFSGHDTAYAAMTIITASSDVLVGASVDAAVASKVTLTTGFDLLPGGKPRSSSPVPPSPRSEASAIPLPAGEEVSFGPEGYGLILKDFSNAPTGGSIPIVLTFKKSGTVTVTAPITPIS